MKIALITDSTADLPPVLAAELGVTVVALTVQFGGRSFPDGTGPTVPEMLLAAQAGAALPKTSQPTPAAFAEAFERRLKRADHVICPTISSTLSGTYGSAVQAALGFGGRVTVIDSRISSGAQGLMVERAARALGDGASLAELNALFERLRRIVSIHFTVATLEFLRKNGRIGAAAALLGGLLSIKPMLEYHDGVMNAVGRPRGAKRALQDTVAGVRDYVARYGPSRAWFIYSQAPADVQALREACLDLDVTEARSAQVGAVIASHVGPHAYGVCLEPINLP